VPELTTIMMEDEKYVLHDWIGQNIFQKIEETLNQEFQILYLLEDVLISEQNFKECDVWKKL
jgi:DNA primase